MKNLIITIAAVIFVVMIMDFQVSFNKMLRDQKVLKFAADEAAATAGTYIDEEAFGNGNLSFDRSHGEKAARKMVQSYFRDETIKTSILFYDGKNINKGANPYVKILLQKNDFKAIAIYEYVGIR